MSKEMLVGMLFTAGCVLPTMSGTIRTGVLLTVAALVVFFSALAWLNCWAIDRWESQRTRPAVSKIALRLAIASMAGALSICLFQHRAALLLLSCAASAALLALLDCMRARLTPITLRAYADLVLLTPAIVLMVFWMAR
jgi:hypothetical protein